MSRKIEDKAKSYLIDEFKSKKYIFYDKRSSDRGFDMWMKDKESGQKIKVELKATTTRYKMQSDIFQTLYFSAKNEVENFESGVTRIIRIFLGSTPPKVFIINNSLLGDNKVYFKTEFRAKLMGPKDYSSATELT